MQPLIWCNLSPLDDLVGFDLLADELYPAGNDSDNNVNFTFHFANSLKNGEVLQ